MPYHILYEACPWHRRAALFDDKGRLLTLRVDDDARRFQEGALILARVRRVEKSLGGAFVDIGDQVDGFLPFNTLMPEMKTKGLHEGQALMVRIARAGFMEKGAKLDGRVSLPPPDSAPVPSIVQNAPSVLTRVLHDAGSHPVQCWMSDNRLRDAVARHVPEKAIFLTDGLDSEWYERLDTQLSIILSGKPTFPFAGGTLIAEMTSAVATVDVNLGPVQGQVSHEQAMLHGNLAAATEVVRLCRLLDLGGSVIVDFVSPKNPNHRTQITEYLKSKFMESDDHFVSLRSMSRHGLVEITRERIAASLPLLLQRPWATAGVILLQLWRTPAGHNPRLKMRTVRCNPVVASLLEQRLTTEVCLAHLGVPVVIQPDTLCAPTAFSLQD